MNSKTLLDFKTTETIGNNDADEVQHEIETAYLDSIAASRTSFDGILSMLGQDDCHVTKSDDESHEKSDGPIVEQGHASSCSSSTCTTSTPASTPGPVSFPGSPDSSLFPENPGKVPLFPSANKQTTNQPSTNSLHPTFGFETGYGPPTNTDKHKFNWTDPSSLADVLASLMQSELTDKPTRDLEYNPPPGYCPRRGMEEVLARMKNW